MRFLIGFVFLLSFAPLKGQKQSIFSFEGGKTKVSLSFQKQSNLIVVPIILNEAGPFNFILDTGSESGIIFDRWVISENNLINAPRIPIYAKDGNKITELTVANDVNVKLEGMTALDQSMLVLEENMFSVRSVLGVDAHGVLGSELFRNYVVEVDYQNEVLTLHEPSSFQPPKGYRKLDIQVIDNRPFVKAIVKQAGGSDVPVNLLIDSGASSALFLDQERHPELILPEKTVKSSLGSSLTGVIDGAVGRVKKVAIGNAYSIRNVVTSFPEKWQIEKTVTDRENTITRHGTLGSKVLSRFSVIFDYANNVIYARHNESFNAPYRFNTTGFTFSAAGNDLRRFFIASIIPGSPAEEADLRPGDEIVGLKGRPAFFYSFSMINDIVKDKPGTRMKIVIKRDGEVITKVFKHRKLL